MRVLDDNAVAKVVINVVAGKSEVEAVREDDAVSILLELAGGDDRVVVALGAQAGAPVVREERVVETHVFHAKMAANAVAAVVTNCHALDE